MEKREENRAALDRAMERLGPDTYYVGTDAILRLLDMIGPGRPGLTGTPDQDRDLEMIFRELLDLQDLNELQHTRTREADKLYLAAHPEKGDMLPDLGRLIEWLLVPRKVVFTAEEAFTLNGYQEAGFMHPFTCGSGKRTEHPDGEGRLVATVHGWVCPYCDYRQDWAHSWMKDGSWRKMVTNFNGQGD